MSRLDDRCKKLGKMKRELGRLSRELDEKGETMQVEAKIVGVGQEIEIGVIGPDEMGTIMALELYESLWEVSLWQAANTWGVDRFFVHLGAGSNGSEPIERTDQAANSEDGLISFMYFLFSLPSSFTKTFV
jgi:hypothetical protein